MLDQSGAIIERFEALEDELNVLKNEIKQNLVDLREFIMKDRTIFPDGVMEPPRATRVEERRTEDIGDSRERGAPSQRVDLVFPESGTAQPAETLQQATPTQQVNLVIPKAGNAQTAAAQLVNQPVAPQNTYSVDATMMSNIIWWLGSVKQRGLTLQQVSPFLDAYETAGYLSPAMSKLIIRSMAELGAPNQAVHNESFAPQEFADCLLQLNNIVCTPGYIVDHGLALKPSELIVPSTESRENAAGELPNSRQVLPLSVEAENGGTPS